MNKFNRDILNRQINILFKRWLFLFKEKEYQVKKIFLFILTSNQVDIHEIKSNSNYIYLYEQYFTSNKILFISIIKKFNKFFEIIDVSNSHIIIYFNDRVFKVYFKNNIHRVNEKKIHKSLIFFYKIKFIYHKNSYLNYLRNFSNKIFFTEKKTMNLSNFLNLNFYPNEIDRLVRLENLSLITNNYKNVKIKDMLRYFKIKNNKIKTDKQILLNKILLNQSFNSLIPISFNLKYWLASNFFLYKNISFGFLKKNIAYELQNKKKNFKFLLDKKIEEIKEEKKIKKILNKNPIIIINNRVYSGRNRILSMLGHLLKNGKFIEFNYDTHFRNNYKIRRLKDVIVEYYNFQKLSNLALYDNSKCFIDILKFKNIKFKKIKIKNNHLILNLNQIMSKNINFKIIEVKNMMDIFCSIQKIFFKKNLDCFYCDSQNRINIFKKNLFLKNIFKILLTIFKPNLIFVISEKKNGLN